MLALSPAAAGAQTRDESAPSESTPSEGTPSVVVRPGDSLWSISEERLGPDASPRRVMRGAERIHALNRERIGADPALVLAGQELTIPRAMSEPPNGATPPARKAAEASGPDPRERAAKGPAGKGAPPRPGGGPPVSRREDGGLERRATLLGRPVTEDGAHRVRVRRLCADRPPLRGPRRRPRGRAPAARPGGLGAHARRRGPRRGVRPRRRPPQSEEAGSLVPGGVR